MKESNTDRETKRRESHRQCILPKERQNERKI